MISPGIYYGPNLECTDAERPTSRNFSLYVAAVDRFDNYSEITTLSINIPPPMAPPAPEVTGVFKGLWVTIKPALGIGIEGYRLYVYQANENWEPVGDPLTYDYPGAMPVSLTAETGLKYVIQVTAFDALGEGPPSPQAQGRPLSYRISQNLPLTYDHRELLTPCPICQTRNSRPGLQLC